MAWRPSRDGRAAAKSTKCMIFAATDCITAVTNSSGALGDCSAPLPHGCSSIDS